MNTIEDYIKKNKVMIFSKSSCPYCIRVKELFKSLGVEFFALEFDKVDGGDNLKQALAKKVGRTSVPQVFIKERHIGGCDDTMEVNNSGKLKELLSA